jgi:hypothetical protein
MSDRRTDPSLQDLDRRMLIAAAALCAIGSIIGLSGLTLAFGAVIGAGRRWYRRADLPAHQLARLKWEQAKAAAGAGAGAWHVTEQEKYSPRSARSR